MQTRRLRLGSVTALQLGRDLRVLRHAKKQNHTRKRMPPAQTMALFFPRVHHRLSLTAIPHSEVKPACCALQLRGPAEAPARDINL